MKIELVENLLGACQILAFVLGIIALIYVGLCLINQKNNKEW